MFEDKKFRMAVIGLYLFSALATYFLSIRIERLNSSPDTMKENERVVMAVSYTHLTLPTTSRV